MEINIKEKVEELVQKIQSDKDILDKFQADPIATLKSWWASTCPMNSWKSW